MRDRRLEQRANKRAVGMQERLMHELLKHVGSFKAFRVRVVATRDGGHRLIVKHEAFAMSAPHVYEETIKDRHAFPTQDHINRVLMLL